MAVLVTGGLGFLGRHLCKRLLDNEDVYCIDTARFMPNAMQYDKELREYGNTHGHLFQWLVHTDINIAIPKLPSKIDVVYNLACTASPVRYKKHPFETLSTSTTGVFHVVQFCRENHAILLHTSTSEVYGDPLIKIQDEKYRGNVSTALPLIDVCVYAVQQYIYNELVFSVESNLVVHGMEIGVFRDIINDYKGSEDKYAEALLALGGAETYEPQRLKNILTRMVPRR